MKIHYLHIILLLGIVGIGIFSKANAQNNDSLLIQARFYKEKGDFVNALRYYLQIIKKEENNTDKKIYLSQIYTEVGIVYKDGNLYEKALEYFDKSQEIYPQTNTLTLIADALAKMRRYQEAINAYLKILNELQQQYPEDQLKTLPILRKIILTYQNLNQYEDAMVYNQKILEIQQKINNQEGIIIAKNNIGYNYKFLKKYNEAIRTFQEVLTLEANEPNPITLINIGICYQNKGDNAQTLNYLLKANNIIEKTGNPREKAQMYDLLSVVYYHMKDYYNARYYNDKALETAQNNNDKLTLGRIYETTSLLFQAEEKYDKALDYFKKHLAIRDSLLIEERLKQQELLQQQFIIERTEKELKLLLVGEEVKDLALKQKEKELQLLQNEKELQNAKLSQEELQKKRALQELLLLKQKADSEKKEREINELVQKQTLKDLELQRKSALEKQKENEIKLLTQNKQLQDLQLKKNEEELKQQRDLQNAIFGIGALGALVFVLIVISWGITRRKNLLLAEQQKVIAEKNAELIQTNEEIATQRDTAEALSKLIAEKNADITDSINYAQRIQQAMLPTTEEISQYLPHHFILFKPRDIVSGDFYWFAQKENKIIVAAADCTGHGVPGGFMSMIGNDLIGQIVHDKEIHEPHLILNELHKGIRKALKQSDTDNRDGMDISLVVINTDTKTIAYAGAKNPLIYVQKEQIFTIKADKHSIGGGLAGQEISFTTKEINYETPTTLYLFSDGYQDQFGGANDKKFMVTRMRELFLAIHSEPLPQQKEKLQTAIEQWIAEGEEEQTDDILVIGLKMQ
ncbi:MAG: hypothetical protein EAZ55_04575 [Cytophagales bacterium]|nr:MAG: hypothetical protein EAZ55_04575 [Cytophagales bacterium]